jgi:hypothetical protein
MYWNYPIIQQRWPSDQDPVQQSLHDGTHCLLYDPAIAVENIQPQQSLQELCNLANFRLMTVGAANFFNEPSFHDWMANLIKIHMMISSLRQHGSVKPFLLSYTGRLPCIPQTGDSRLKALERLPSVNFVSAVITTKSEYRTHFPNLISIETFDQLANICSVYPGTDFMFRPTNALAPYGLDWFEYSADAVDVPAIEWCITVLKNYIAVAGQDFTFSPGWFDQHIDWNLYQ